MKRVLSFALVLLFCGASSAAPSVPWRVPNYSVTARAMPVRELLETFAVAEGVPAILSKSVGGSVSGTFRDIPADEFLDRVATVNNLTWYYDGASLWVYSSGEVLTTLIDLAYMKADEVLAMMRELGVEDARFPIKKASNDELIMVSGPPRYVMLVSEMIGKADRLRERRTFAEVETRIFQLKNTWADTVSMTTRGGGETETQASIQGVAQLLQEIMGVSVQAKVREGTNETGRATAEELAAPAVGQPVIRAENRLNAVVVRDVATRMPMYERLIAELDRPQKLVEITVTKLEMSRGDALDWEASVKVGFEDSRNVSFVGQNANSLLATADEGALAGLTGGYSYLGDHMRVSASIRALKENGKARSISRSSLLTLANLAAEMSDTQSYNTRLVGEKVASVSETSAGTRLFIKPRIVEPPPGDTNVARHVWLTMELQDGGFDYDNVVDGMPKKSTSLVETQAALPEGHSLLVAGNFYDVDAESTWGIPYLRDIPWIGWLFGGVSKSKSTVQRLFVLTPHVIDMPRFGSESSNALVTVQQQRLRDTAREEDLEEATKRQDWARRHHAAELKEAREIHDEREKEKYERDEEERGLREEKRRDSRREDREAWREDFRARERSYEAERREKTKREVHESLTGAADSLSPKGGNGEGK